MNLDEIKYSVEKNPPKTEIELQTRVLNYCMKNKIDFIQFSTIGRGWSRVNKYSEEEFYNESFGTKKETITETNERLSKYIKNNYLQKKDCVVWFSTFFGLASCRFYDAAGNKSFNIIGTAKEEQENFKKLADLYHTF